MSFRERSEKSVGKGLGLVIENLFLIFMPFNSSLANTGRKIKMGNEKYPKRCLDTMPVGPREAFLTFC